MCIHAGPIQSSNHFISLGPRVTSLRLVFVEHSRDAKIDELNLRGVAKAAHQISLLDVTVHDPHSMNVLKGRHLCRRKKKKEPYQNRMEDSKARSRSVARRKPPSWEQSLSRPAADQKRFGQGATWLYIQSVEGGRSHKWRVWQGGIEEAGEYGFHAGDVASL